MAIINRRIWFLAVLLVLGITTGICPQAKAEDSDLSHDIGLTMGWWSDQFASLISFCGSSEMNASAKALPVKGLELGFSGNIAITNTDANAFKRLDYYVFERGGNPPFTSLALPSSFLYIKYGLPGGYDVGLKSGGLSLRTTDNSLLLSNNVTGAELRMQLFEQKTDGFDFLGSIAVNSISGKIEFNGSSSGSDVFTEFNGTTTYNRTYNSNNRINVNWNFASINLKGIASRRFSWFAPFAGLQADINMGKTNGEMSYAMTNIHLTQTDNPLNTRTAPNDEMSGASSSSIPQVNLRILYGFDLLFGDFKIWFSGESADINASAALGLRYQF
ncbi:MAG: hypothetical protein A2297_00500 [Elusimicrobia bacterium RIFOXYB2_FULL_48_7]|nr:MAG: hypothetical protein A2297_00500 [Elusimicrobia bacterium RIFOXYB2_FULL_48_7]